MGLSKSNEYANKIIFNLKCMKDIKIECKNKNGTLKIIKDEEDVVDDTFLIIKDYIISNLCKDEIEIYKDMKVNYKFDKINKRKNFLDHEMKRIKNNNENLREISSLKFEDKENLTENNNNKIKSFDILDNLDNLKLDEKIKEEILNKNIKFKKISNSEYELLQRIENSFK